MYPAVRVMACILLGAVVGGAIVVLSPVLAGSTNKQTATGPVDTAALAAKVAGLAPIVKDLEERKKIHDVLMNYGRGIDRLDEQTYRKAFWPDAKIGYGTNEVITPEQHWSVHMMKWHQEGLLSWGHLLTNETIDIDGDEAHVETYAVAMPMQKDKAPGILWGGRYIDRVERRNGEWRIAAREYIPFFAMKTDKIYAWLDGYKSTQLGCEGDAWSWRGQMDTRYLRPLPARTDKALGPPCNKPDKSP